GGLYFSGPASGSSGRFSRSVPKFLVLRSVPFAGHPVSLRGLMTHYPGRYPRPAGIFSKPAFELSSCPFEPASCSLLFSSGSFAADPARPPTLEGMLPGLWSGQSVQYPGRLTQMIAPYLEPRLRLIVRLPWLYSLH